MPKIPTRLASCCSYSLPIALILGASAFTFSTLVSGYAFTKKELQGVKDIHLAQRVLLELMEARGLEQFPEKIIPKPALITHNLPNYTTTGHALQEPTTSNNAGKSINDILRAKQSSISQQLNSSTWNELKRRYGLYRGDIKLDLDGTDPKDSLRLFDKRSAKIHELSEYIDVIRDKSNLTLDPRLNTYYLMELTTKTIPSITSNLAKSRGLRIASLNNKSNSIHNESTNYQFC